MATDKMERCSREARERFDYDEFVHLNWMRRRWQQMLPMAEASLAARRQTAKPGESHLGRAGM